MNDIAIDDTAHTKVMDEFIKYINEAGFLPLVRYGSIGARFDASFGNNDSLNGTNYLADPTQHYLHFTSLEKLESIVDSQSIRFYNMHKSEDVNEYMYASKMLSDLNKTFSRNKNQIEKENNDIKKQLFYTSFCTMDSIKSILHWENYADEYKGVAIEFEIKDDPLKWKSVYFSKIKYDNRTHFDRLLFNLNKLNRKYQVDGAKFELYLSPFFGFHKSKDYFWENEVRILIDTFDIMNRGKSDFVFEDDNSDLYFKIPLWSEENEYSIKEIKLTTKQLKQLFNDEIFEALPKPQHALPQLVIRKLHFIKNNNKVQMEEIKYRIKEGLGYDVEIVYHDFI